MLACTVLNCEIYRLDPSPARSIRRPGVFRSLEERLREKLARSVGLCFAACETGADAIWLRGHEKHTGEPVSACYFGSGRSFAHLVDKLYADHVVERRVEGLRIWSAPRYLREAAATVDICFADLPWPYSQLYFRREFLHIPGWIIQKIMLPDTWEGVLKQFRKNTKSTDLRKVRKYKLDFTLANAPEDLRQFYDTMYVPYAKQRFGELSVIDDFEEICGSGIRGALLQVRHEQRVVGGVILYRWRRIMHFLWFGLLVDLEAGLLDAALSGIYLFSIQHAYAEGCTELNLSYTIPLLNDGVYRYKRKWGAGVHDAWKLGEIVARPVNFNAGIQSFFSRQPLIVREGDRLVGKILVAEKTSADEVEKLVESYASEGLQMLKFYSAQPFDAASLSASEGTGVPTMFIDLSRFANPALEFCRQ